MKNSVMILAAVAALLACGLAQAGGHNDKGTTDAGQFVGDSHGNSFADKSAPPEHDNSGNNGGGSGSDNGKGKDVGNHGNPNAVSAVPEAPVSAMMLLAGGLMLVTRRVRNAKRSV
jgi:hypothetical protein